MKKQKCPPAGKLDSAFYILPSSFPQNRAHTSSMPVAERTEAITVEEYLSGELSGEVRHEYLGGTIYAMAGASEEHNTIAGNIFAALHTHVRGKPCRVFMVDMKVRLVIARQNIFYYPDLMVVCDSRDTDRYFKRYPKVLIEVLSEDTERTDRREKFLSYTGIETLEEYVLVAQDRIEVTVFRRNRQWEAEVMKQADQQIELASLAFILSVRAIYEGLKI